MSHNRRGKGTRPILETEIRAAQSISTSAADAARKLGVHYSTYKRWARKYGIHDFFNQRGKGLSKVHTNPSKGRYPLNDILDGKHPTYPTHLFKKKLIASNTLENKCELCGFSECRSDGQTPLLIRYKDGNPLNKAILNIQLLCYNHAFIHGIESSIRHDRFARFEEPDKMQKTVERIATKEGKTLDADINFNPDDLSQDELDQLLGNNG